MIKNDGAAIFYRGLLPILNCQIFLYLSIEWSRKLVFEEDCPFSEYIWPFLVGSGIFFAHPWMLLASKVYCSRISHPRQQNIYSNSLSLMNHLVRKEGVKSLYRGLGPASLIYLMSYYDQLYYLSLYSYNKIF